MPTLEASNTLAPNPAVKDDPFPHQMATEPSAISHEPEIRPRSQKGAQPSSTPPPNAPEPSQGQEQAPQGEVVGAEPTITDKQRKMFFAISRSANLNDDQVKKALAGIGLHCHRDNIPKTHFRTLWMQSTPSVCFTPTTRSDRR